MGSVHDQLFAGRRFESIPPCYRYVEPHRMIAGSHWDRLTPNAGGHIYLCSNRHWMPALSSIRYGIGKGLPTGSIKFESQIEAAVSIKLGNDQRGV
jgi:hypothetical protein